MATTRGRIVFIGLTLFIIYFLFIASPTSQLERDFRRRTREGLKRRHGVLQGDISDEELMRRTNEKLQNILINHPHGGRGYSGDVRSAYDPIETGQEEVQEDDEEDGEIESVEARVAAGHRKHHGQNSGHPDHVKPRYPLQDGDDNNDDEEDLEDKKQGGKRQKSAGRAKQKSKSRSKEKTISDPAKDIAREKLQVYLKKPVVIFSKSYCPHSKQAKYLLTELYKITPAPLIVEIDELTESLPHPQQIDTSSNEQTSIQAPTLGAKIQELLFEITGRRTVPNIMVNMHSIGGNDLIWDLHKNGKLGDEIRNLAGKRVSNVQVMGDGHGGRET